MQNLATFLMFAGASLFCLCLYGMQRRPRPLASRTAAMIQLVHCIKVATRASRGQPNGDTLALRAIVDLIKHFQDTH